MWKAEPRNLKESQCNVNKYRWAKQDVMRNVSNAGQRQGEDSDFDKIFEYCYASYSLHW